MGNMSVGASRTTALTLRRIPRPNGRGSGRSAASAGSEVLDEGRLKFWIKRDIVKGVTPPMLVWWFGNLEGDMEVDGRRLNRYRVWHPFDHVHARYARRLPDGSIGPGAQIELLEYLGRNPKYKVDVLTTIEKLDEEGYIHNPVSHGVSLARMEYTFREVGDGTLHENCLIVPRNHGSWFFRKVVVPVDHRPVRSRGST